MRHWLSLPLAALLAAASPAWAEPVQVKDLGRFEGWRDNVLVGYGVVIGLAGSGDSPRSQVTQQALKNILSRFGANVPLEQVRSRNVAAVMVTASMPASSHAGDHFDVQVSSIGDARSLLGGVLLLTPLMGPDQQAYALAQGPLVVGGYRYDANLNVEQKNHPTSALVPGGGTIERSAESNVFGGRNELTFILKDPDFTTAERIADGVNAQVGAGIAQVRDATAVRINAAGWGGDIYRLVSQVESISVTPASSARVVINERSGTIVAGGGVRISSVVISQGDIKVSVTVRNEASQPLLYGGYAPDVTGLVVTNTRLRVSESPDVVAKFPNTTVADLVEGLGRLHVKTREMIGILQGLKSAGALHADIIVQ